MTVYADELFFINFIACYALLYFFSSVAELNRSCVRLFLSAATGGIIAVVRFCTNDVFMYISIIAETAVPIIAFRSIRIKQICLFIFIKYIISGFLILLMSFRGTTDAYIRNGTIYLEINYIVFVIAWFGTYIFSVAMFRILRKRRRIYTLRIRINNNTYTVKALYDSGNSLRNPYSSTGVVITDLTDLLRTDTQILIPYNGLNSHGMLSAVIAREIFIEEKNIKLENIAVAVSEQKLSKAGRYNALIGPAIFKE